MLIRNLEKKYVKLNDGAAKVWLIMIQYEWCLHELGKPRYDIARGLDFILAKVEK